MATSILSPRKRRAPRILDRTGLQYGWLTALEHVASRLHNGSAIWRCRCQCGNLHDVEGRLLGGLTGVKSCGCLLAYKNTLRPVRNSTNLTHGETGTKSAGRSPEYKSWASMIQRCTNPKHFGYQNYGGKGVKVCAQWIESFEVFLKDMGRRPTEKHSIDRINPNLGYEPENCRWATWLTQANNRTNNRRVIFNGELMTCSQLARLTGIPERTVYNLANRVKASIDITEAVNCRLAKH